MHSSRYSFRCFNVRDLRRKMIMLRSRLPENLILLDFSLHL